MNRGLLSMLVLTTLLLCGQGKAGDKTVPDLLGQHNVVWNELGTSSADSMPLGNGDVGLNVWTEQNGDLVFYIGKNDAWGDLSLIHISEPTRPY